MSRPLRRLSSLSVALLLSGCVSAATAPAPVTPSPEPVPSEAPSASPVVTPTVAPSFKLDGEVRFRGEPQAGGKLTVTDLVTGVAVAPAVTTDAQGRFGHTLDAKAGSAWLVRAEFSGSALEAVAVVPEGASSLTVVLDASTTAGAPIAAAFAQAAARLPEAGRAAALQKALAAIAPITTSIQRAIEANPATANAFVTASPAAEARGASLVSLYGLAEARQHVVGAVKDLLTGASAPAEAASTRLLGTRLRLDWAAGEAVPTLVNEDTGRSAGLNADARALEIVWRPSSGSSGTASLPSASTFSLGAGVTSETLSVDGQGNAWVTSFFSDQLVRIPATAVDDTTTATFTLTRPQVVRFDGSNNAWVGGNSQVTRIPAGATTLAGATSFTATNVYDLLIRDGFVWAGDANNAASTGVTRVPVGAVDDTTSLTIATHPNNVHQLAADGDGNLWVTHLGGSRLVKVPAGATDSTGNFSFTTTASPFKAVVDGGNNVWVVNETAALIERLPAGSPNGTALTGIVLDGRASDIAVDSAGNAWVTVPSQSQVVRISPAGVKLTFTTATASPERLLIDSSGTVWVSHTSDAFVSRIAPGAVDNTGVSRYATPGVGKLEGMTATHLWFRGGSEVYRMAKP